MRYTTNRFGEVVNLLGEFASGRRPAQTFVDGDVDVGNDELDISSHGYSDGDGPHQLTTTGTLPAGLNLATDYYFEAVTGDAISLHLTRQAAIDSDPPVTITGAAGGGTHTIDNPIRIELMNIATEALVPVSTNDCTELTAFTLGGASDFSTYHWATSNITTHPTTQTELLYRMRDAYTGRVQKGKFVVGGFPDESARRRYQGTVHIDGDGAALTPATTMTATNLTFATGATDTITKIGGDTWDVTDSFKVGDRLQITGSASNDGVTVPIVAFSGGGTVAEFPSGNGFTHSRAFTSEINVSGVGVVNKAWTFDEGSDENPVTNARDARQIADELELRAYHFHGGATITIDFPHDEWTYEGGDPDADIVTFVGGATTEGSRFDNMGITGALNGRIIAESCILTDVTELEGVLARCGGAGTWTLPTGGGVLTGLDLAARNILGLGVDFGLADSPNQFLSGSILGIWHIRNMDHVSDILGITCLGAEVDLQSTITAGQIRLGGVGEVTDDSTSTTTFRDDTVKGSWLTAVTHNTVARAAIDTSTDPWEENRYVYRHGLAQDFTIHETYELYDQDGVAIAGDATSGNNPLADPTVLIAERKRV
jgi:hypothetical protein